MRSAEQIKRTPGQWHDHQRAERERNVAALAELTRRARETNAPWYLWIIDRQAGAHRHNLHDEQGRAIACPVAGCDAVRGSMNPHQLTTSKRT